MSETPTPPTRDELVSDLQALALSTLSATVAETVTFAYDHRPVEEQEAERRAMWEKIAREGCDLVDHDGNVIARLSPGQKINPSGPFVLKFAPPSDAPAAS